VSFTWAKDQQAVFDFVANGTGNAMVDAVAGSGKTTTILEALRYVPEGQSVLFVAFAKATKLELEERTKGKPGFENVTISTLHSLGLRACRGAKIDSSDAKLRAIVLDVCGGAFDRAEWRATVAKVVSFCKSHLAETPGAVSDVMDLHDVSVPGSDEPDARGAIVRDVMACLVACEADRKVVDFDDMVWMPVVADLRGQTFDRVFVDEVQDLNAAQIALTLRSVRKGGRVVGVGDPRQAIYGFRGAHSDAFEKVRAALDAVVLPLSVSYRCSRAVIREAQKMVPHIMAAPDAVEGSVQVCTERDLMAGVGIGDFILSRTNAPLMGLCLALLRDGQPAAIQGRDVGAKLVVQIRKAKTDDVPAMLAHLKTWTAKEVKRLAARELDAQVDQANDVEDCIGALAAGETSCEVIIRKIERMFADGSSSARITLSTTHRAKGAERKNVWLLRSTYLRSRGGRNGAPRIPPSIEEHNLLYVAVTRAKINLYLVMGDVTP
jgi:superfamily I DNA/RNA helicase